MFIGFINFFQFFIQKFSKIAILFIFLLKITKLFKKLAPKMLKTNNNEFVGSSSNEANETTVNLSKNNKSRNLTCMLNIKAMEKSIFLILNAKKAFNYLKQALIKASILEYFNLKSYIQIETNVLCYAIDVVLSYLNLNFDVSLNDLNSNLSDFGQWHLVAYFFGKMIFAKT